MRPVMISGSPDGLGELTSTQKTVAGVALLAAVVWFLTRKK